MTLLKIYKAMRLTHNNYNKKADFLFYIYRDLWIILYLLDTEKKQYAPAYSVWVLIHIPINRSSD